MEDLRHDFAQGNQGSIESAAEDEVERLKTVIGELGEGGGVTHQPSLACILIGRMHCRRGD